MWLRSSLEIWLTGIKCKGVTWWFGHVTHSVIAENIREIFKIKKCIARYLGPMY